MNEEKICTKEGIDQENTVQHENIDQENCGECELEKNLKSDILEIFDNPEYAYILKDVMDELKDLGYDCPGQVVTHAINNGLLYVDNIEEDGTIYIALVDQDEEE